MSTYIATVLDTTGIQPYIFGSNRLRENIGASYLASQATDAWVRHALRQLRDDHGHVVYIPQHGGASGGDPHIDDGKAAAELVYAAGGNAVLLFADIDLARHFARILTAQVLREAPGLSIVVAHREFEWGTTLHAVVDDLMAHGIDRQKRERVPSSPLLGLGVTAACASTGLAAVATSDRCIDAPDAPERKRLRDDRYPVAPEIAEKLRASNQANAKLADDLYVAGHDELGIGVGEMTYIFPYDLDNLGRSVGESSYVAVVHADGNGMGDRFKQLGKRNLPDPQYIEAAYALSYSIDQAGRNALRHTLSILTRSIRLDKQGHPSIMGHIPLAPREGHARQWYLPFRPLVYGGDDVTFVCDGRLGLALAELYLRSFENQPVVDGGRLTACAGICVTKTHYPFARAYALSEELCRRAKGLVRAEKVGNEAFSVLDWHIAASGLAGSLGEIREREYRVGEGYLEMRPVRLRRTSSDIDWRTWSGFSEVTRTLRDGPDWRGRRNKVIALREALRAEAHTTAQFVRAYGLGELPRYKHVNRGIADALARTGWYGDRCGYFDAVEAMEFYTMLDEGQQVYEGQQV